MHLYYCDEMQVYENCANCAKSHDAIVFQISGPGGNYRRVSSEIIIFREYIEPCVFEKYN